jgi:hypothetical protein
MLSFCGDSRAVKKRHTARRRRTRGGAGRISVLHQADEVGRFPYAWRAFYSSMGVAVA